VNITKYIWKDVTKTQRLISLEIVYEMDTKILCDHGSRCSFMELTTKKTLDLEGAIAGG